jgi:hypothetical protein
VVAPTPTAAANVSNAAAAYIRILVGNERFLNHSIMPCEASGADLA